MKHRVFVVATLAVLTLLTLAGCASGGSVGGSSDGAISGASSSAEPSNTASAPAEDQSRVVASGNPSLAGKKALIVYYSRSGHTERIAKEIEARTGADAFLVEPEVPYTDDTDELSGIATREKNEDARPPIVGSVSNMDEYDVVFLGYPCWWSDMPMIMYTFLDQHSLDGKVIVPFTSYGESVWGRSLEHIQQVEPNATLAEGYATQEHDMDNLSAEVGEWLARFGF